MKRKPAREAIRIFIYRNGVPVFAAEQAVMHNGQKRPVSWRTLKRACAGYLEDSTVILVRQRKYDGVWR